MTVADELRAASLTGALDDDQLSALLAAGREVGFGADEELFHEGNPADVLWILLEGEVELSRRIAHEDVFMAMMNTPGQWAGGLTAWGPPGAAGYRATGRSVTSGRAFVVPSDDLGRLVEEWLPFGKHMIMGVYQTVRNIDATARERESLVALGTLTAGLAHEINNPAAAALRSIDSLSAECDRMLAALVAMAEREVTAPQYRALDALRRDLDARVSAGTDPVAAMDLEEAIGSWLEERGVDHAWYLAGVLAAAGADHDWLAQVDHNVGRAPLGDALAFTTATVAASQLLAELTDATARIARLVADVKSYSQMDRAALQRADVHEGIDATLAMLAHKLEGIRVERDFDPEIPSIEVFASELNQVWNNLIDNAVDAMNGQGTLRLATRFDGERIVVEVTDSGVGIEEDVLKRVFEPFFTTKDVGRGTGLGLDISRRIVVDRHGGEIRFDSVPGRTTATVTLPIRR